MKKHDTIIQRHSLIFWLFPLITAAAIIIAASYMQPYIKDFTDHILLLTRLWFI